MNKRQARPLRVLQVYRTYFPDPQGGLQEAIRQACLATRPHGVRHRVFTLSPTAYPQVIRRPEAAVYRAPQHIEITSSGFSLSALPPFRALVNWADLLHYHFPWPFADILDLLVRTPKPRLITYHSDIVRQRGLLHLYRPLMKTFLGRADRIIATSPAYFDSSPILKTYAHKLEVVPLGLDANAYPQPTPAQHDKIRRTYGRDYFLFIGVLRYYKGLDTLLDAADGASFQVVIAGEGPEGAKLRGDAHARGLRNVQFAGLVSDAEKVALIQHCRALVFPSNARSEAFGIALLEAAMLARPLICSELGTGTTYINRHEHTGLVVPPQSPAHLRVAMQALANDPTKASAMGQAARHRFEALFSAQALGKKLSAIYHDLASQ